MKQLNIRPVHFPGKEDGHFKKDNCQNWWEEAGDVGNGALKTELSHEIEDGIEEYKQQLKEGIKGIK